MTEKCGLVCFPSHHLSHPDQGEGGYRGIGQKHGGISESGYYESKRKGADTCAAVGEEIHDPTDRGLIAAGCELQRKVGKGILY